MFHDVNTRADFMKQFGIRLRAYRKAAGMTQTELGALVGAEKNVIAKYETARVLIPIDIAIGLSQALNISFDDLLGLNDITLPLPAPKPKKEKETQKHIPIHGRVSALEKRVAELEVLYYARP